MPLNDESLQGTNADKSKNEDYCTYCYKDGGFTQEVTMEEMIEISRKHMSDMFANDPNYDEQEAVAKMQSFFPQLKRWKN